MANQPVEIKQKASYTFLPKEVRDIWAEKDIDIDNFALLLNKYVVFSVDEKIKKIPRWLKNGNSSPKLKAVFYQKTKDSIFKIFPKFDAELLRMVTVKNKLAITELSGCEVQTIDNLIMPWRMAIGMGNASVFENNISLHHVYGFPYISASSIKGLINHWAQDNGYNIATNPHYADYCNIFGTTERQGRVLFFDAFPARLTDGFEGDATIQPDIMNNHYQDYYNGDKPPADWQSPNPVFFLTIYRTKFIFHLGGVEEKDIMLVQTAKSWLQRALIDKGIGAKTAVGYGYMQ